MSKQNIPVDEFTSPSPLTVSKDASIEEVIGLMEKNGIRHIPVVDESGKPVGIISDRDANLIACFEIMTPLKASDVMVPEPFVAQEGDNLEDVVFEMSTKKIGSAVILDENLKVTGVFTSTDALNALVEVLRGIV